VELVPDFVVLPQNPAPDPSLAEIASLLGLETDENGYLQSANVHRLPLATNRAGVIVAGPARDAATPAQLKAQSILGTALALIPTAEAASENRQAVINNRACIHCLTCFRICPHKAVHQQEGKLTVMTNACQACGICAAECPRIAISMEDGWLVKDDAASKQVQAAKGFEPKIFVYTCENSSAIAAKAQEDFSWPPNTEVFSLPCLGGLSLAAILRAIDTDKADGVLALACHEGNCHSGTGSLLARRRIKQAAGLLKAVGADSQRVGAFTLAANSETALKQAVEIFWEQIKAIGPARPAK
jgi:coenzyme F420-reducing hydrogenase delta subunit/Pyruvate/2-oxoacid:ferredoxin oxidoreductase delta subunit